MTTVSDSFDRANSSSLGSDWSEDAYRWQSQTSHPAMIRARNAAKNWAMIAKPNNKTKAMIRGCEVATANGSFAIATRLRATFEYIGPALLADEARRVWGN